MITYKTLSLTREGFINLTSLAEAQQKLIIENLQPYNPLIYEMEELTPRLEFEIIEGNIFKIKNQYLMQLDSFLIYFSISEVIVIHKIHNISYLKHYINQKLAKEISDQEGNFWGRQQRIARVEFIEPAGFEKREQTKFINKLKKNLNL